MQHFTPSTYALIALPLSLFLHSTALAVIPVPIAEASYSTPVPEHLEPFAHFPLEETTLTAEGLFVTLAYNLPEDLTGQPKRVSLTGLRLGHAEHVTLWGHNGRAECQFTNKTTQCKVQYKGLGLNPEEVNEHLQNRYGQSPHLDKHLAVAAAFGAEPIGIISLTLERPLP